MSRQGGNKLAQYFVDYIGGATKRAYSSYYVVKLPHGSVLMCKKVGHHEKKEIVKFSCPKGSVTIFYGDTSYTPEIRDTAKHKVHKNGHLAHQINDNFMDLKLLDFREYVGKGKGGTTETLIGSLMFEDQGNNLVMQMFTIEEALGKYLPSSIDETRQYIESHTFRVPKEIKTIDEAEKYWFEKEYQTTPDKCYRIVGKMVVPCSNSDLKERILSSDTMTRIVNPYTGLAPRSIEFIRKFNSYFRGSSSFAMVVNEAKKSSGAIARDIMTYKENLDLAHLHEAAKSKAIDYLFSGAILTEQLPAFDYIRDENESEYIKGSFKMSDGTVGILNNWHLIC